MRILFTPLASTPHVNAMVSLAWAARAAGHEVRFAAQPAVRDAVVQAGLPVAVVGASHDLIADIMTFLKANPQSMRPGGRVGAISGAPQGRFGLPWIRSAQACAPELVAFGEAWRPHLVVTDPMFYAGPLLADVLGVPLIRHLWSPDWTKAGYSMGGFAEGQTRAEWPEELLELYRSYGARTETDTAACTVDPFPPGLQLPGLTGRVSVRGVAYNGTGDIPPWLSEQPTRPRVLVSRSTSNMPFLGAARSYLTTVLGALSDLDIEVVLTREAADATNATDFPANVRLIDQVPYDLVLPTCAAIVHHAGASSLLTSSSLGVPQVTIPMLGDQPANAALLAKTGAGIHLDFGSLDPADIRAAVQQAVSDPQMRDAAARLSAGAAREMPLTRAVDLLADIARVPA
ncbi:nucleotide disphospho-sugar-binding domain-containing protein [Actinoplanes teichomyceticus]|uniref:Tylactone mycaminosyltransferase n=1 Tax=Actinoplanes teichomyceticus TaxID=1867 RepID=A0A561WBU5_ACTTI|nr:nucleotide disphospho-sugar-binding domain-containing protein [Actinoplanes teichomyceticus]TWG21325.1 tylactone mycaminosyltransferase [Actinoplanes teichomyceticus]GIF16410.1 glycosyl transferase [Actinoplanes teichomyceticus]